MNADIITAVRQVATSQSRCIVVGSYVATLRHLAPCLELAIAEVYLAVEFGTDIVLTERGEKVWQSENRACFGEPAAIVGGADVVVSESDLFGLLGIDF
jgi:hypothetical protein